MTPIEATITAVATVLSALYVPGDDASQRGLPSFQEAAALTRVTYNEAASEDAQCKAMVAQTIMNRHAIGNQSLIDVAMSPNQFAAHKPRVENVIDHRAMLYSAEAAVFIYAGLMKVPNWARNVTHFHDSSIPKPASWGPHIVFVGKCGGLLFYVENAR